MKNQPNNSQEDALESTYALDDDHSTSHRFGFGKIISTITILVGVAGWFWWKFGMQNSNINPNLTNVTTPVHNAQENIVKPHDAILPVSNPSQQQNLNPVLDMSNKSSINTAPVSIIAPDLGQLPNWDLSDIYKSINDPKITSDIAKIETDIAKFIQDFKGKINKLDGIALAKAIKRYEDISDSLGRLGSFASLNMAIDSTNESYKELSSSVGIKISTIGAKLAFFTLELSKIPQTKLTLMYKKSPTLLTYSSFLQDVLRFKNHMLSEDVEQYSALHSTTTGSWSDLFDEIWSRMRFNVNGKNLSSEEVVTIYQTNPDRTQRAAAAAAMENEIKNNSYLFSFITNTLAKDKSIEDKIRSYNKVMSYRNLSNNIEDNIVDLMISTVKSRYKDTSHRYYSIKSKLLGLEKLAYYDRSAPLNTSNNKFYKWDEAKEIVLSSYTAFSPTMGKIAEQFFTRKWIDAQVTPNKRGGAFCAGISPSLHPYVLVNYLGKPRDVSTLGHELGHGIHDVLASKNGYLSAQPPLTLAETASIFGEELVFAELLKRASSNEEKIALLSAKIEDSIATMISQVAYAEFERKVHESIKVKSNLTMESMNEMWISSQKEALGDVFDLEGYQYHWMRIPHFIHTPFYVYSYTFGNLLVNALYDTYTSGKISNFQDKYMELLASGGTKSYAELLKKFNLDASTAQFWNSGMDVLVRRIDELERLISQSHNDKTVETNQLNSEIIKVVDNPITLPHDNSEIQSANKSNDISSIQPGTVQNQIPSDKIIPPKIPKL